MEKVAPLLKSGTSRAHCLYEPKTENCCIIWKIHQSMEESTVLSLKQKKEKEWRWDTALRTLESAHVKPLKLSHMEARSFPDTFFATLPD